MNNLSRRLKSIFVTLLLTLSLAGMTHFVMAQNVDAGGSKATPAGESQQANSEVKDENDAYRHSAMVQKFGHMLGMSTDTASTVFEVFNFAILALAVLYGLFKFLPKTFRDRSSAIQKHLVDARTATEEASVRLNSVEERLGKLDGQIAEMKAQAEKDAVADEQRIKTSVEEERVKILAAAEQEITAATSQAQRQLQQYAAELAIEQAARKLVVSAETDRLLVQNFARRLGQEGKGGDN